jgi:hypothetical protein
MATVKKGLTVRASEWWKHLRPFAKRSFWKKQRRADKRDIKNTKRCEFDGPFRV